jgi:hypothetical protein
VPKEGAEVLSRCRGRVADMEVQRCMCSGFAEVLSSRCRGSAEVIVQVICDCSGAEQCKGGAKQVQNTCRDSDEAA